MKWEVRPFAGEETGNRKRERGPRRVVKACTCLRGRRWGSEVREQQCGWGVFFGADPL